MASPMNVIFAKTRNYAHTTFTPAADEECFICKEPYESKSGCHPTRLTECGHTMGLECFNECATRTPFVCPYGGHDLPAIAAQHNIGLFETLLAWLCSTLWFRCSTLDGYATVDFNIGNGAVLDGLGQVNLLYCVTTNVYLCYQSFVAALLICAQWLIRLSFIVSFQGCIDKLKWMILLTACNGVGVLVVVNCAFWLAWRKNMIVDRPAKFKV
jgi:hypothetical protein